MGVSLGVLVDGSDLASHGRIDIGCDLDTLNHDSRIVALEALSDGGHFEMDDLSELLLGIVGDANTGHLAVGVVLDPLVTLGVLAG